MSIEAELDDFSRGLLNAGLESGRYRDANELIGTALYRLQQQEAEERKEVVFYQALDEGFQSPLAPPDAFERMLIDLRERSGGGRTT